MKTRKEEIKESRLDRVCWSAITAFTLSVFICLVCSIIDSFVYNVNDINFITYGVLLGLMFIVFWVLILGRINMNYNIRGYKKELRQYRAKLKVYNDGFNGTPEPVKDFEKDYIQHREYKIKDMNISKGVKKKLKEKGIITVNDLYGYHVNDMYSIVGTGGLQELLKGLSDIR